MPSKAALPRSARDQGTSSRKEPTDDIIIIGVDFGTTFSGVAWAYSREPDDIEIVTSWDAEMNHCSDVEKTPTQLYFGDQGESTKWGYSIPADKQALRWFKLLLLDDKDIPIHVSEASQLREARELRTKINKDPVEVIACFLRNLWNHTIDTIKRSISAELLQECRFHVIITMPAIWPFYAQQRMKKAAQISGILEKRSCGETTLRFISEPEAAALATMKDLSKRSTTHTGDTIVVCDAGGGTVDLISYVIESMEPFVVKECVKGDGGLCGGVFLDEEFLKLIKGKLLTSTWNLVDAGEQKKFLNDGWEHGIKPQFENQPRTWLVDLPESCDSRAGGLKRRKTLEVSSYEMLSVFSPIVKQILELVDRQVKAVFDKYYQKPKARDNCAIGGFGRSRYLFNQLQEKFSSTVLQSRGNKPWTAICRGAVVYGLTQKNLSPSLQVKVGARISRMSYGVEFKQKWKAKKHQTRDKVWDEQEHEFMAENQMKWFLEQGDCIDSTEPIRQNYYRLFNGPVGAVEEEILISSAWPPPVRKDASVRTLCKVKWNKHIPLESLKTWTNPIGKVYHQLEHDVEMTCDGGTVDFTVYHDEKRVAGHNIEVKCD
ncbi:hypothetical protein B0T10DRAFT_555809 [Thelonectria olida]|uniref:Uncharacterized protein n=1 Tax=Thelonectria olida TaxID=1576542 RepID=A0A9P8WGK2_9HYPO|nr:hypothetical protein B0T10DRAFT_555809 [Thelonectria olida]